MRSSRRFRDSLSLIALGVFAFTTVLGWSVYGERCVEYIFGIKAIVPFRILWVLAVFAGTQTELTYMWLLADTLNAMMALPNVFRLKRPSSISGCTRFR